MAEVDPDKEHANIRAHDGIDFERIDGEAIRIISARKATRTERETYDS